MTTEHPTGQHAAPKPPNPDAAEARILVVDDEPSMRFVMRETMRREGYTVEEACDGVQAVERVRDWPYDLVILDVQMPRMDGIDALREIKRIRPNLLCVVVTAYGSREVAVEAVRQGAYDYFSKPFEVNEMRIVVRRALEKQRLLSQIASLETRLRERLSFDRIIGRSDAMRAVFDSISKVVTNDVTVLITGESGTGKELVAQAVHYQSARKSRPFVSVNCAAIPETLLESELFGHEKGAFTGAVAAKPGRFEAADSGSIFLDEIGDMPLALQAKILRVLQEGEVMRVGGRNPIRVDVRVIAATNQNLAALVDQKLFRLDLFYRLNVFPIHLPPLRQRREDIPLLVEHFVGLFNTRLNRNITGLTAPALDAMTAYPWPGNVREMENAVQRAMIIAASPLIDLGELPPAIVAASRTRGGGAMPPDSAALGTPNMDGGADAALLDDFSVPLPDKIERLGERLERRLIQSALAKCDGHRQATADLLGISRKSLHNKMGKYGLFEGRADTENDA